MKKEELKQYILEAVQEAIAKDQQHGNMYGDWFYNLSQENKDSFLQTIATKLKIKNINNFIDLINKQNSNSYSKEKIGQMFSVFAGIKPMFYGNVAELNVFKNYKNTIVQNIHQLNLAYAHIGQFVVFGKQKNVSIAAKELERINKTGKMDARFHRIIGITLGYPKKDVEEFVRNHEIENLEFGLSSSANLVKNDNQFGIDGVEVL